MWLTISGENRWPLQLGFIAQLSVFTLTATQVDRLNPAVLSTDVQFVPMAGCLGPRPEKVDEGSNNYNSSDN